MRIAYISVIRNDTDIIQDNLIYYYNIGIRDFYLRLHLATDKLKEIISNTKKLLSDAIFKISYNNTERHYHDEDCKVLTDMAMDDGIEYILGTDADEIFILKRHNTIQDFWSDYDKIEPHALYFKWYTYHTKTNIYENAFIDMQWRDLDHRKEEKAIGKIRRGMYYVPGLHIIMGCGLTEQIDPGIAYYAHFPDRNIEQYEEKYNIQKNNWLTRYGSFPFAESMDKDPGFLKKNWLNILDNNNKRTDLIYDPINSELFKCHIKK